KFVTETRTKGTGGDERFRVVVKIVGRKIVSGRLLDGRFFAGRKFGLKMVGDGLCDFALNSKNIGQIAIIGLRPKMCIDASVDQLRVLAHFPAGTLNTSFEQIRDAELFPDLAQVASDPGLVWHHARPTDY